MRNFIGKAHKQEAKVDVKAYGKWGHKDVGSGGGRLTEKKKEEREKRERPETITACKRKSGRSLFKRKSKREERESKNAGDTQFRASATTEGLNHGRQTAVIEKRDEKEPKERSA